MELKPISKQKLLDYRSGKFVDVRNITKNDFYLDIEHSTPHAGFALRFNDDKKNGFFVEVGAGHWQSQNNTYILEKHFDWQGVAIDIMPNLAEEYNQNRSNNCVVGDAMSFNWDKYFEENNFPKRIDYLQIDVDKTPEYANLFALLNLPLSRYRFNAITLEHCYNMYPQIGKVRDLQREIMFSYGYTLVAAGFDEDWWIDEQLGLGLSEYVNVLSETWKGNFI